MYTIDFKSNYDIHDYKTGKYECCNVFWFPNRKRKIIFVNLTMRYIVFHRFFWLVDSFNLLNAQQCASYIRYDYRKDGKIEHIVKIISLGIKPSVAIGYYNERNKRI